MALTRGRVAVVEILAIGRSAGLVRKSALFIEVVASGDFALVLGRASIFIHARSDAVHRNALDSATEGAIVTNGRLLYPADSGVTSEGVANVSRRVGEGTRGAGVQLRITEALTALVGGGRTDTRSVTEGRNTIHKFTVSVFAGSRAIGLISVCKDAAPSESVRVVTAGRSLTVVRNASFFVVTSVTNATKRALARGEGWVSFNDGVGGTVVIGGGDHSARLRNERAALGASTTDSLETTTIVRDAGINRQTSTASGVADAAATITTGRRGSETRT